MSSECGSSEGAACSEPKLASAPPKSFSFITWNIDGLDEKCLEKRIKAICEIIETEAPDIVFLQELTPATCSYVEANLQQYELMSASDSPYRRYFTATLLRKLRVNSDGYEVIKYAHTTMGRNLLCVEAHIGSLKLTLLNTHLESMKDRSGTRKQQLRDCFSRVSAASPDRVVIFAGDLNLRDHEVKGVGGVPPGVSDLWVRCGRPEELEFTWDTEMNTNRRMPGRFKPRMRFDRVYLRDCERVTLEYFGFVGLEKVKRTQSFPSDHWGIQLSFGICEA